MFEFENKITIYRGVDDVFSFATDLIQIPKWNYYVINVTPTSSDPGTPGATYHQVRQIDEQDLRIVKIEQNKFLIVETIAPSKPEFRREMIFEGDGKITHIIDRWHLDLFVSQLFEPFVAHQVKNGIKENLGKLKVILEDGRVILQDGRAFAL